MSFFHKYFATWFGCGLSPKAPGTMGSLGTLPFVALLVYLYPSLPYIQLAGISLNALGILAWLIFIVAIPSVKWVIQSSGNKDPQQVVIDEVAGQTLAFAFITPALLLQNFWMLPAGFALFRLFDITKILGIKKLEHLPGAWGVMADDMLGGIYAGICLAVIAKLAG